MGKEREPEVSEQFVIQSNDTEQATDNLHSEVTRLEEKLLNFNKKLQSMNRKHSALVSKGTFTRK